MDARVIGMLSIWALLAANTMAQTAQPSANAKEPSVQTPTDDASIPQEPNAAQFGRYLPHTMAMLKASEQGDTTPIRVLFYGQSIVAQGKVQSTIIDELRKAYPKANIVPINHAIGGYEAPELARTITHDVVPARPDLIIFHDYAGEQDGNYEEMIRFMRANTPADILMWNHHFDIYGTDAARESQGEFRRQISEKYRCEFVDLRSVWTEYHKQHNLPRKALLADGIHNNPAGCQIMGKIIARHFVQNPDAQPTAQITTIPLTQSSSENNLRIEGNKIELDFTGVRVDAIGPADVGDASGKILLDGKSPSSLPSLWITTRPSPAVISWFPGVNRVSTADVPMVREDWTLHCFDVSKDGKTLKFRLNGSVTGADGEGSSADPVFVSKSGRVRIEPNDFSLKRTYASFKKDMPAECDIRFTSYPLCLDTYQRQAGDTKTDGARQTLLNGLTNEKHHLTIIADGDKPLPIQSLVVYRPVFAPSETR